MLTAYRIGPLYLLWLYHNKQQKSTLNGKKPETLNCALAFIFFRFLFNSYKFASCPITVNISAFNSYAINNAIFIIIIFTYVYFLWFNKNIVEFCQKLWYTIHQCRTFTSNSFSSFLFDGFGWCFAFIGYNNVALRR